MDDGDGQESAPGSAAGRTCLHCGEWKPAAQFGHYPRRPQALLPRCRECGRERVRASEKRRREAHRPVPVEERAAERAALRAQMCAAYGGRCACCGEDVPGMLHVEPVVRAGRVKMGHEAWVRLQKAGWPDTHELVCANCSLGKLIGGGVCPHRAR